MAAYIEHIQALAQRIDQSDALPLRWNRDDTNEGLYHFLASKMDRAGLLDAEHNGTSIAVLGLTNDGYKLIRTGDPSAEFLDSLQQTLYDDPSPKRANPHIDSA
jgi:hypothetical protein